jgi:hypothetical protein
MSNPQSQGGSYEFFPPTFYRPALLPTEASRIAQRAARFHAQ